MKQRGKNEFRVKQKREMNDGFCRLRKSHISFGSPPLKEANLSPFLFFALFLLFGPRHRPSTLFYTLIGGGKREGKTNIIHFYDVQHENKTSLVGRSGGGNAKEKKMIDAFSVAANSGMHSTQLGRNSGKKEMEEEIYRKLASANPVRRFAFRFDNDVGRKFLFCLTPLFVPFYARYVCFFFQRAKVRRMSKGVYGAERFFGRAKRLEMR